MPKKRYRVKIRVSIEQTYPKPRQVERLVVFGDSLEVNDEYDTLLYVNWMNLIWNRLMKPALEQITKMD